MAFQYRVITLTILMLTAFQSISFAKLPIDELRRYDLNKNGLIDLSEEDLLYQNLANAVMRTFDVSPTNGRLDVIEVTTIEKASEAKFKSRLTETQIDEIAADIRHGPSRRLEDIAQLANTPKPIKKSDQRLFLRKDRLDISVYNKNLERSSAQGALIDLRHNEDSSETEVALQGFLTYVLSRQTDRARPKDIGPTNQYISGYAIAPWLEFDHRTNNKNPAKETDKLIIGIDGQFTLFGGSLFGNQVVTLGPHFQTDFGGQGEIYGGNVIWEPYNTKIALGSYQLLVPGLGFTWQAHAEANYRFVKDPGKTNFNEDEDFMWLGGGVKATFWLLPEKLNRKLYAVIDFRHHYDTQGDRSTAKLDTRLNYNLDQQGLSAFSLSYENGENFKTGKELNQYKAGISIKY